MKRLPVIRHIRWLYLSYKLAKWAEIWSSIGYFVNQSDIDYLDAVWRGDA